MAARSGEPYQGTPRAAVAYALVLFAYAVWFRTHGLAETFALRGDQIRDWTVALRPITELPLSGVPSTAGGATIGPAYYWFLWLVARVFGPFADDLPHAGGIGIAAAHSLADAALVVALARRTGSTLFAVAIAALLVTSPYDATLSGTIWNPPVAEALVKVALAIFLWHRETTVARAAAVTLAGWLALHCHTGAAVAVLPMLAFLVLRPMLQRHWMAAVRQAAVVLLVIAVLQVPWALYRTQSSAAPTSRIEASLGAAVSAPAANVHLPASAAFVAHSIEFLLAAPLDLPYFGALSVLFVLATAFTVRDAAVQVASVGSVVAAVAAFALLQGELNEVYWCLPLTAPAALAGLTWMTRLPRSVCRGMAALLLLAVVAAQPARASIAWHFHRLPEYGAIVRGSRAIVADARPVREVVLAFPVPYDTDPLWVYSMLGGSLVAGDAASRAVIARDGSVRYE